MCDNCGVSDESLHFERNRLSSVKKVAGINHRSEIGERSCTKHIPTSSTAPVYHRAPVGRLSRSGRILPVSGPVLCKPFGVPHCVAVPANSDLRRAESWHGDGSTMTRTIYLIAQRSSGRSASGSWSSFRFLQAFISQSAEIGPTGIRRDKNTPLRKG